MNELTTDSTNLKFKLQQVMLVSGETILGDCVVIATQPIIWLRIDNPMRFMFETDERGNIMVIMERMTLFSDQHVLLLPEVKVLSMYGVIPGLEQYYRSYVKHCQEVVDSQNELAFAELNNAFQERVSKTTDEIRKRQEQSKAAIANASESNTQPEHTATVINFKQRSKDKVTFVDLSKPSANSTNE